MSESYGLYDSGGSEKKRKYTQSNSVRVYGHTDNGYDIFVFADSCWYSI